MYTGPKTKRKKKKAKTKLMKHKKKKMKNLDEQIFTYVRARVNATHYSWAIDYKICDDDPMNTVLN